MEKPRPLGFIKADQVICTYFGKGREDDPTPREITIRRGIVRWASESYNGVTVTALLERPGVQRRWTYNLYARYFINESSLEESEGDIMREGMLWFDNDENRPELSTKIERAAAYYESKYGSRPTLCFVHPLMLLSGPAAVEGIEVRATNSVLPNHFWLGVMEKKDRIK